MKLKAYLDQREIDPAAFAASVGVTRQAVMLWLAGERIPRPKQLAKIAEATADMVTYRDFLEPLRPEVAAE